MNWISNTLRPKIRNILRREVPENLWIKCPETGQLVFYKDVESNLFVIPGSNYHMRMGAAARLKSMFDNQTWFDIAVPEVPLDPLKFRDERAIPTASKRRAARPGLMMRSSWAMASSTVSPPSSPCRISISWAARSAWRRAKR